MNYKVMGWFVSRILAIEAAAMVPSLILSIVDKQPQAILGFLTAIVAILTVFIVLSLTCHSAKGSFYAKDGLVCVGVGWIVLSILGCLPFWISGEIPHFVDALFEMVSGFTTTGASILTNVEALSRGMLYWRSFSHWLGGMGVLVFLLALAPQGGKNSGFTMHLLRAESPGPDVGKLVPRMKKTASILYLLYIGLTVINIIFLLLGGMSIFEAFCIGFGTAGTGGFAVTNSGMAGYSPYIQVVTAVFMLLFGINFSCFYLILLGQFRSVLKDEELRLYLGIFVCAVLLIALNLYKQFDSVGETLRHVVFQVSSIMTTTGFATYDFNQWPGFSKGILLCLMVTGACAGSTAGGIKVGRVILLFKTLARNIRQMITPQRVQTIRTSGRVISEKVVENTNAYLAAYVIIVIFSYIFISKDGFSVGTNLSAVLACFNNIGPGLDVVGPMSNFSTFSNSSKIILILDMLAGRLEIFPILILFSHRTWNRKHR